MQSKVLIWGVALCFVQMESLPSVAETTAWHSPVEARLSTDAKSLAVCDQTSGKLALLDPSSGKLVNEIPGLNQPTSAAWGPTGKHVFVSEYGSGTVAELDLAKGDLIRRIPVGHGPMGLAIAAGKKLLLVCNSHDNDVSLVDMDSSKEKLRIPVVRQPSSVTVTPDESVALVSNLLPLGDATDPKTSACVSVIDLSTLRKATDIHGQDARATAQIDLSASRKTTDIRLPPGSTNCRQIAISSDGRWAYVVHTIGRTQQPTLEIEAGWINVNAMSILDLQSRTLSATVYLDRRSEGAANS